MKTAQVVKAALVLAILLSLFKMIARPAGLLRGWAGGKWDVRPYALERFEDEDEDEVDDDEDVDEDEGDDDQEDYETYATAEDEDLESTTMMNDMIQGMTAAEDYEGAIMDEDAEYQEEDFENEGGDDEGYDEGYDNNGYEGYEEDAENETVETFTNTAAPSDWSSTKGLMNVATDLLPKPTYKDQDFAEFAPKALLGQNFLETKKYIGVDTKGSSMRNANYDLRSTPSIPRQNVGPWAQSTIDADQFRKPLE